MPRQPTDPNPQVLTPLPRDILDSPQIRAQITEAKAQIREGRAHRGRTADELLELGRERNTVDPQR